MMMTNIPLIMTNESLQEHDGAADQEGKLIQHTANQTLMNAATTIGLNYSSKVTSILYVSKCFGTTHV